LILLTFVVVIICAAYIWNHTRDLLHPMMLLAPLLIYMYGLRPFLLQSNGQFLLHVSARQLNLGLFVNALVVTGFCFGLISKCHLPHGARISFSLNPNQQQKTYQLGCILGCIALAAYWYGISESGGFIHVYGHAKGMILASSGYISEAPMLAFPAIMLVFLSRRGRQLRPSDIFLGLVFASPHLLHGILGARRGPTFLVMGTLIFSWYVATGRRPKIIPLALGLGATAILLAFLISHRGQIYLGSDVTVDSAKMVDSVFPTTAKLGDDVVFGIAQTNVAESTGRHYWGSRLGVILLVRPIPRQIWPTKYEDSGFGWMKTADNLHGYKYREWREVMGWRPSAGSSGGFAADLFCEFSWFAVLAAWGFGRGLAYLWRKAILKSGIWTIFFLESLILSIYIPTQSISAFMHRFVFISAITLVFWRLKIGSLDFGSQKIALRGLQPEAGIPGRRKFRRNEST